MRSAPLGVLPMEDEGGGDAKLLAVPIDKVLPWYKHWKSPQDLAPERLAQIQHFFEHYKDLEPGKWVKIVGWTGAEEAKAEIVAGVQPLRERPRSSRRSDGLVAAVASAAGRSGRARIVSSIVRVGVAQINCTVGDFAGNRQPHRRGGARPRRSAGATCC